LPPLCSAVPDLSPGWLRVWLATRHRTPCAAEFLESESCCCCCLLHL
jgi:hypothetical protein